MHQAPGRRIRKLHQEPRSASVTRSRAPGHRIRNSHQDPRSGRVTRSRAPGIGTSHQDPGSGSVTRSRAPGHRDIAPGPVVWQCDSVTGPFTGTSHQDRRFCSVTWSRAPGTNVQHLGSVARPIHRDIASGTCTGTPSHDPWSGSVTRSRAPRFSTWSLDPRHEIRQCDSVTRTSTRSLDPCSLHLPAIHRPVQVTCP